MAASKFDLSSSSPDGLTHLSAPRNSYGTVSLERVGSFREGTENRLSSLLPSMSRSGSTLSQTESGNLVLSILSDMKSVFLDQRYPKSLEFKRGISSILGISPEDPVAATVSIKPLPSSSMEDVKRMKSHVIECSIKARERTKALNEALSKIDKYFHMVSKKRSRAESSSSDRANAFFPGAGTPKLGAQSHININSLELAPQKTEERVKASVPNRRIRTSMVEGRIDARANGTAKPSGPPEKDKEIFKLANGGPLLAEEKGRVLTSGVDGWEKPKMKKKRSVIKSDFSMNGIMGRPLDSDREPKRGMQQKLGSDQRPRLNNTHGLRSGPVTGTIGGGKADLASQQNNLGMRPSPRSDHDSNLLPSDRRDRSMGLDKEGATLKAANKQNGCEDNMAGSPSLTKLNASIRAPRSNSGSHLRASPNTHRVPVNPDDWEHSQSMCKANGVGGAMIRKSSSQSASPPVVHLVGQRPQKISRVARRSNLPPPASSHDESALSEPVDNVSINEEGLGPTRHMSSNFPQVRLKGDHMPPASLSENDESGIAEIKSKDKMKKCSEIEEKATQSVQKVATLILPSRKNKVTAEEDNTDGCRRQGRIGRGYTPSPSIMPAAFEKLDNTSNIKQMRSARVGMEKIESKPGRPPNKKLSERKAYTRPRHSLNSACLDSAGESDDDHEELLAAAKAALNTRSACPSSFWKQVEPHFGFLSAEDKAFLNEQIRLTDEACASTNAGNGDCSLKAYVLHNLVLENDLENVPLPSTPALGNREDFGLMSNGTRTSLSACERTVQVASKIKQDESLLDQLVREPGTQSGISICQALLSAIIEEEEVEKFYNGTSNGGEYLYDEAYGPKSIQLLSSGNFQAGEGNLNGAKLPSWQYHDGVPLNQLGTNYGLLESNTGASPRFGNALDEFLPNHSTPFRTGCTEFQYNQMSISDRILVELSEIGLHPEPVPDLTQSEEEDIVEGINSLEEMLHEQVMKKKSLLLKLEKAAKDATEDQERKRQRIALDKLVGLAYDKYMDFLGPSTSGGKNASKAAKQSSMAFIKRTLARCQKFEKTGISCFNEPAFRDIFVSISSRKDTESMDIPADDETSKRFRSSQHSGSTLTGQFSEREEPWLHKGKRREVLLDDVVGCAGTPLRTPSGLGSSLTSGTKGKRSGRDRDGRGQNKDTASRTGTVKIGRPSLSNVKGERKNKTKPKQKITQLSASVNGILNRTPEQPETLLPSARRSHGVTGGGTKDKDDSGLVPDAVGVQEVSNNKEAIELSSLQLPELDVGDFAGQGQDIASWLNIDDDEALQDHDFMGLEIPMDDLSEVNMML